jgi:hypothetical protein
MTGQPTSTLAIPPRTDIGEAPHPHDTACYWDVDDCRWRCTTATGPTHA